MECTTWSVNAEGVGSLLGCCLQGPGVWQLHHTEPGHPYCRQPHLYHHAECLISHSGKLVKLNMETCGDVHNWDLKRGPSVHLAGLQL